MHCSNCGNKIEDNSHWCNKCQTDPLVEYIYCPNCGEESDTDVCEHCKQTVCRFCGKVTKTEFGICEDCKNEIELENFSKITLVRWIVLILIICLAVSLFIKFIL